MKKVDEAREILISLGVGESDINKIAALSFLALCGIKKDDDWNKAKRQSVTLTKDIIHFVNKEYDQTYKPNTRESFRNEALRLFLNNHIVDLNPDNPNLPPQSKNTHYSITTDVEQVLKHYKTSKWAYVSKSFVENLRIPLINRLQIENYKSVETIDIELSRFNVLIGANGSGKSNIIEALAMMSASLANDLDLEGIMNKGVRLAKPNLTFSSFVGKKTRHEVSINLGFQKNGKDKVIKSKLISTDDNDIYAKWIDSESGKMDFQGLIDKVLSINDKGLSNKILEVIKDVKSKDNLITNEAIRDPLVKEKLAEFLIYNLTTQALRGLSTESKKQPLGINGEGLDVLLNNFSKTEFRLLEEYNTLFDWLDKIKIDKQDELKNAGFKLGKSNSKLYFTDKYMLKKNNLFSAENANEGILHVLFYLSLFISKKTPFFFAIDNIETALNPKLCRFLVKNLIDLAKKRDKQVIITTHNPAILDGLNLTDNDQRLFEVYRTEDGSTKTRRIKFKDDLSDKKYKISTMWLNGLLGATPKNF